MDRNFELDEVYEEIDFIPEHKKFPVELNKIVKREKYKPFFDFEEYSEDFEEL